MEKAVTYDGFCMILASEEGKSKTYCARAASSAKREREKEKDKGKSTTTK